MDSTVHIAVIRLYCVSIVAGAFFIPAIFSHTLIRGFINRMNRLEGGSRDRLLLPVSRIFMRMNIHPNAVTGAGVALTVLLMAGFNWGWSSGTLFFVALAAGLSDMFDGALARAAGKVSSFGGAFDGIRDGLLFCSLTLVVLFRVGASAPLLLFFSGVLIIETLKGAEILFRARFFGWKNAFMSRCRGVGKLSIDRVKFFLVVSGYLGFLLEDAVWGSVWGLGSGILWIGIGAIIVSLFLHGAVIALDARGVPETALEIS